MICIVEGPDGVGKSTLVERLAAYATRVHPFNVTTLKAGPPRDSATDEYVTPLLPHDILSLVICDRWHLGELVYPTVLDRPSRMDINEFKAIENVLKVNGAAVIHVCDEVESLEAVLRTRGDDLVIPEQAGLMIDLFYQAVNRSTLPVMDIHARTSDDDLLEEILEFVYRAARENYVG